MLSSPVNIRDKNPASGENVAPDATITFSAFDAPCPTACSRLDAYLFCPGAKLFALVLPAPFFSWPGASERPWLPVDGEGLPLAEDVPSAADEEEVAVSEEGEDETVLLDPPASAIPLAALLKMPVVALLSALMATTTLVTSKSKSIAYSGADTPAWSLATCRNMLTPQPT